MDDDDIIQQPRLFFHLSTQLEGNFYIIGNMEELGNWNVTQAKIMKLQSDNKKDGINKYTCEVYPYNQISNNAILQYQYIYSSSLIPGIQCDLFIREISLKQLQLHSYQSRSLILLLNIKGLVDEWNRKPSKCIKLLQQVNQTQDERTRNNEKSIQELPNEKLDPYLKKIANLQRMFSKFTTNKTSLRISIINEAEKREIEKNNKKVHIIEFNNNSFLLLNIISNYQGQGLIHNEINLQDKKLICYVYDSQEILKSSEFLWEVELRQIFQTSLEFEPNDIQIYQIMKPQKFKIQWFISSTNEIVQDYDIQKMYLMHQSGIKLVLKSILDKCGLGNLYYSPEYNNEWSNYKLKWTIRGPTNHRYKYFYPIGWKGFAINVLDYYGNDQAWLARDGNEKEWRILYHGTKQQYLKNIILEGLVEGSKQAYANSVCLLTNQIVGKGVYFSNQIQTAEQYTQTYQINQRKFKILLQVRVKPSAVRQPKKTTNFAITDSEVYNDYFVVNNREDIRIYRILIKEIL